MLLQDGCLSVCLTARHLPTQLSEPQLAELWSRRGQPCSCEPRPIPWSSRSMGQNILPSALCQWASSSSATAALDIPRTFPSSEGSNEFGTNGTSRPCHRAAVQQDRHSAAFLQAEDVSTFPHCLLIQTLFLIYFIFPHLKPLAGNHLRAKVKHREFQTRWESSVYLRSCEK